MEWKTSPEPVPYEAAVAAMEARVARIRKGEAEELVWLLEHPPLYTAGTSAKDTDLLDTLGFPVYPTGRGGQYTYHGPGQRVAYVMLDLKKRTPDVRRFVKQLERWIIATLSSFGVKGEVREGRVGVWVKSSWPELPQATIRPSSINNDLDSPIIRSANSGNDEKKIAALGVRVRQWMTYHGISINVNPDLSHYRGIVPCGISEHGVTSLAALGKNISMSELDQQLVKTFDLVFADDAKRKYG